MARQRLSPIYESDSLAHIDNLAREAYGFFGIPLDAVDRETAVRTLHTAIEAGKPFLLSTPNVNFMMMAQKDGEFKEALLTSNLCPADGMPLVWLSRILNIPIKERVSGADLFDTIRTHGSPLKPVKVFLFGGAEGVAERLGGILNGQAAGIRCVGWLCPGFGSVEDMSSDEIIKSINSSGADLLAVFLSAKKAQAWLLRNHDQLSVPVRGQFGATINYQAGLSRRAPVILQKLGLEWLWRIKEEPYLWRRYGSDGLSLVSLLISRGLPILFHRWRSERISTKEHGGDLLLNQIELGGTIVVNIIGQATERHAARSIVYFRQIVAANRTVCVDLSKTKAVDPRYFGLLLMLRKELRMSGHDLVFRGASKQIFRHFQLNGFAFLLHHSAR